MYLKSFFESNQILVYFLAPPNCNIYDTRSSHSNEILSFEIRHNFFTESFFNAVISEWNDLGKSISNFSFINVFKEEPLKFIRQEL